jgi:hypothetical protein
MQIIEATLPRPIILKGGHHGDTIRVEQSDVTAIDVVDGMLQVTRTGHNLLLIREWVHATAKVVTDASLTCDVCQAAFKTTQALGAHRRSHGSATEQGQAV